MTPWLSLLPAPALIFGSVGVFYAIRFRRATKRWDALKRWVAARGWGYEPGRRTDIPQLFRGRPFSEPVRTYLVLADDARDVAWGRCDVGPALLFRFTRCEHRAVRSYPVAVVTLPYTYPWLEIYPRPDRPEAPAPGRLGDRFRAAFAVETVSAAFATDVLNPDLMASLLGLGTVGVRFEGNNLLCWQRGVLSAEWADGALQLLSAIAEHLPGV